MQRCALKRSPGTLLQVISPAALNEATDDELRARVLAVVSDPALKGGQSLPPLAPFITYELLFRLRSLIAEYSMEERSGWSRQASLAKVVINVTGAHTPSDFTAKKDFEAAGNAMDSALVHYQQQRSKARKGQIRSANRARKSGKEPPDYTRFAELQQRIYRCSRGCTPRQLILPAGTTSSRPLPIHRQPTRWTVAADPDKELERIQAELIMEKTKPASLPVMEGVLRTVINNAVVSGRRCVKAEQAALAAKESETIHREELAHVKQQHAEAKKRLKKQQAESAAAIAQLEKKNLVLGAQIARAVQESIDEYTRGQTVQLRAAEKVHELELREKKLREAKSRIAREARAAREDAQRIAFFGLSKRSPSAAQQSNTAAYDFSDCEIEDPDFDPLEVLGTCAEKAAEKRSGASALKESADAALALKRMRDMPTWQPVRGKGSGKGGCKIEWGTRAIIYSLLSMMVPCSAIGSVIVAIVSRTAPWLKPCAPTKETVRRCRFELRFVEEASAARQVASCFKVRGIGFDETTKLGHSTLTSNVTIEPVEGAPLEDIVLRAAYCPTGGTAEKCVESIDKKCFSRLRTILRKWEAKFTEMFPEEVWTGPDPSRCALHRLGGGGAIMSDTCNTARASKRLLAELIAKEVEEHVSSEAWQEMSPDERKKITCTYQHDCWQHLRNIFLAEMSRAQVCHAPTKSTQLGM